MLKKGDVKSVGLVTVGVLIAGFIMAQFADVGPVDTARSGFGA